MPQARLARVKVVTAEVVDFAPSITLTGVIAARVTTDLSFRVGGGTDTFARQDGAAASITCDAAHPCQLSVKVQIPYGFGFRTFPLTFA